MSRDEAIAYLTGRGLHVRPWRHCHPESFAVCGAVEDVGDDIKVLKYLVVVIPTEHGWSVESETSSSTSRSACAPHQPHPENDKSERAMKNQAGTDLCRSMTHHSVQAREIFGIRPPETGRGGRIPPFADSWKGEFCGGRTGKDVS